MNELLLHALSLGFTKAVWMSGLQIECEERLRAYCTSEACPNHGNNWVCPPACGTLDECAGKAVGFRNGILLQSISELAPPVAESTYKTLNREHNLRLKAFIEVIKQPDSRILALTSGGCVFCDSCSYPNPCIKPDVRMNSLSAYGIDVAKLCKSGGLDFYFRPDRVYFTALVLLDAYE